MKRKTTFVDLTYLESMSEGNEDLIREMIDIFKKQIPEFTAEMKAYLERKDWDSLGAIAHKAKSSVYIMGMNELAGDLKTLEMKAKKKIDVNTFPAYIDKFISSCDLAVQELDKLFNNH